MDCVQAELTRAAAAEESLHVKLSTRDKKIAHLEERLAEGESRGRRLNPAAFSEEMDTIREELGVLRGSLSATDPQQEILDGLEKVSQLNSMADQSSLVDQSSEHLRANG